MGEGQRPHLHPRLDEASKPRGVAERICRGQRQEADLPGRGEDSRAGEIRYAQALGFGNQEAFRGTGHGTPKTNYFRKDYTIPLPFPAPLKVKYAFNAFRRPEEQDPANVILLQIRMVEAVLKRVGIESRSLKWGVEELKNGKCSLQKRTT